MFRLIDSPLGPLRLQASPRGLSRVEFTATGALPEAVGSADERDVEKHSTDVLDAAQAQLAEYFAGRRRAFELPLDPPTTTEFRAAVHAQLTEIGYGETVTYRDVGKRLGRPGATRPWAARAAPIPCSLCGRATGCCAAMAGWADTRAG